MTNLAFSLRVLGFVLVFVSATQSVFAEEAEELIVLGSRIPSDPQTGVEIIDRQTLDSFGAASLTQVLSQLSSIHVNNNAGRGSLNSLYLRGADPNFTQIQINGIPVNDPMNNRGGAYDIGSLSALSIERIEILPASASALYGSQALAGVVNITTRDSAAATELSTALDSHGGYGLSVLTGGEHYSVSGFVDSPGAQFSGSDYRGRGISARTSLDVSDRSTLTLSGRLQDTEARAYPDDSGGDLYAVSREREQRDPSEGQLDFSYTRAGPDSSRLLIQGSFFQHEEDIFTPAVAPGPRDPAGLPAITSANDYRNRQVKVLYHSPITGKHRFAGGVERHNETGSTQGGLDFGFFQLPASFDLNRQTTSAFGEWQWLPGSNFRATLGGRLDRTDTGDRFNPRVNIEKSFPDLAHTVYATWGEGYKLPSFYALGYPLIGNPDLLDETSRSYEVGYRYSTAQLLFGLVVFWNEFDNLIDLDVGPPPRLLNRDKVSANGFEARMNVRIRDNLSLKTHYSFVDTEVKGVDVQLRHRPRHNAVLHVDWQLSPRLWLGLNNRLVGDQFDSSIPTGNVELSSYFLTDGTLQWNPNDRLLTTISVDNIFDRNYEDSIGNPSKGVTVRLYFSYRISRND